MGTMWLGFGGGVFRRASQKTVSEMRWKKEEPLFNTRAEWPPGVASEKGKGRSEMTGQGEGGKRN